MREVTDEDRRLHRRLVDLQQANLGIISAGIHLKWAGRAPDSHLLLALRDIMREINKERQAIEDQLLHRSVKGA